MEYPRRNFRFTPEYNSSSDFIDYKKDFLNKIFTASNSRELYNSTESIINDICMGYNANFSNTTAQKMKEYITEHYNENISLYKLSKVFYLSPSYLGAIFQKEYKTTFQHYLQAYRMNYAKKLILTTNDKISFISNTVGYKDMKTFREVFKKHFGILPSELRDNT